MFWEIVMTTNFRPGDFGTRAADAQKSVGYLVDDTPAAPPASRSGRIGYLRRGPAQSAGAAVAAGGWMPAQPIAALLLAGAVGNQYIGRPDLRHFPCQTNTTDKLSVDVRKGRPLLDLHRRQHRAKSDCVRYAA